jgi:hypothetical protein
MQVRCLPEEMELAALVRGPAGEAARALSLPRYLLELSIWLDDIAPDERVWLDLRLRPGGGTATLYLHPSQLLLDRPLTPAVTAPWDLRRPAVGGDEQVSAGFSRPKADRVLHHQFLALRDLCEGSVRPGRLPAAAAEGFQELWAVTVDGRLRRLGLPGFSAAERRRRFSRTFASHGVLLPAHWRIFHELWEVARVEQERLLAWLRQLPGGSAPAGSAAAGDAGQD